MAEETGKGEEITAFAGVRLIATGAPRQVAEALWRHRNGRGAEPLMTFDDCTGDCVEMDLRGTLDEVLARHPVTEAVAPDPPRGPGRPKLGVVAREVTLLPRHWEWLSSQPGGASVALRKLVEAARKQNAGKDRVRLRREAAHKFMWTMAGDLEGFEEASRALFAAEYPRLEQLIRPWPEDVREYAMRLIRGLVEAERAAGAVTPTADPVAGE